MKLNRTYLHKCLDFHCKLSHVQRVCSSSAPGYLKSYYAAIFYHWAVHQVAANESDGKHRHPLGLPNLKQRNKPQSTDDPIQLRERRAHLKKELRVISVVVIRKIKDPVLVPVPDDPLQALVPVRHSFRSDQPVLLSARHSSLRKRGSNTQLMSSTNLFLYVFLAYQSITEEKAQ